jgi:uncharacterized protein
VGSKENRLTALKMIDAIASMTLDESILTDDVSWWAPGHGSISKLQIQAMTQTVKAMLAGPLTIEVRGIAASGNRVAVEAESHADLLNGKVYANTYHFLFLFRQDRICLVKEYNDTLHASKIFG